MDFLPSELYREIAYHLSGKDLLAFNRLNKKIHWSLMITSIPPLESMWLRKYDFWERKYVQDYPQERPLTLRHLWPLTQRSRKKIHYSYLVRTLIDDIIQEGQRFTEQQISYNGLIILAYIEPPYPIGRFEDRSISISIDSPRGGDCSVRETTRFNNKEGKGVHLNTPALTFLGNGKVRNYVDMPSENSFIIRKEDLSEYLASAKEYHFYPIHFICSDEDIPHLQGFEKEYPDLFYTY